MQLSLLHDFWNMMIISNIFSIYGSMATFQSLVGTLMTKSRIKQNILTV